MSKTQKKMVQQLGDGQCICAECWKKEYPNKPEPEINWTLDYCGFCCEEFCIADINDDPVKKG